MRIPITIHVPIMVSVIHTSIPPMFIVPYTLMLISTINLFPHDGAAEAAFVYLRIEYWSLRKNPYIFSENDEVPCLRIQNIPSNVKGVCEKCGFKNCEICVSKSGNIWSAYV